MFYSKYSDYLPEQIITDAYQIVCNELLSMAKDESDREKMKRNII